MPEMHSRYAFNKCIYRWCFWTIYKKTKKEYKKLKKQGNICQKELDKACFQHGIAYGDFKIYLEEQLLIRYYMMKHLILLKIQNMMGINMDFL